MDISRRVFAGVSNIFLGLLISPAISADFFPLTFSLSIHLKSVSIFRIGCSSWRNSLCSSTARVLPGLSCRLQAHVFCWRVIGAAAPVMSCGVCPQGSGWDAQRATWILGKWSIGRERNQNNLAQERKRSRCAKCLIGYVVVWNMLVGHLFIYLAGIFFLSESYNFIYWSVPFSSTHMYML